MASKPILARPGTDYNGVALPDDYVTRLKSVTAKRARSVIMYLLEHGTATNAELEEKLGYTHGPRAVRDVRELGFPVKTLRRTIDGKSVGVYAFDTPPDPNANMLSKELGRTALSNELRDKLIAKYGSKCFITLVSVPKSELQVDHRIPYEIGGEPSHDDPTKFMLLTGSSNRRKSWACEHCSNWTKRDPEYCATCFWAYPEHYTHVADNDDRVLMLAFTGTETEAYDRMHEQFGDRLPDLAKKAVIHQLDLNGSVDMDFKDDL